MRAVYILPAVAAVSHAFYFPAQEAKSPWRTLFGRQSHQIPKGPLASNEYTAYGCMNGADQANMNLTELSYAQAALLGYCDSAPTLQNTDSQPGKSFDYGGTRVLLCNMDSKPYTCNSTEVSLMLDQIWCSGGSDDSNQPQPGWGQIMTNSQSRGNPQYVQYGQIAEISGCASENIYNSWGSTKIPCANAAQKANGNCS